MWTPTLPTLSVFVKKRFRPQFPKTYAYVSCLRAYLNPPFLEGKKPAPLTIQKKHSYYMYT